MGDDDDCQSVRVEFVEQPKDLCGRGGVEVAGGLVAEDESRLAYEGAGERDPLFLAAGKVRAQRVPAMGEADLADDFHGASSPFPFGDALVEQAELDVVGHGPVAEEVKSLEHEPDPVRPHCRSAPI